MIALSNAAPASPLFSARPTLARRLRACSILRLGTDELILGEREYRLPEVRRAARCRQPRLGPIEFLTRSRTDDLPTGTGPRREIRRQPRIAPLFHQVDEELSGADVRAALDAELVPVVRLTRGTAVKRREIVGGG
jgi:hypothetical protein